MKKIASLAMIPALFLLLSLSCRKKSSTPSCKLIEIVDAQGLGATTYDIRYNSAGQIATIQATGDSSYSQTFTYTGNLIMISTNSAAGAGTDSVVLNGNTLISYSQSKDPAGNITIDTYTYDGSGELMSSTAQVNGGAITTTTYTFSNGDLISSFDGTTTTSYSYNTAKAFEDGDPLKESQLLGSGGLYIKNTHLLSGIQIGGAMESFAYTFDSDGKIIGVTKTSGASIETFSDQYDCA
jgi:hypothetical protein